MGDIMVTAVCLRDNSEITSESKKKDWIPKKSEGSLEEGDSKPT